MVTNQEIIRLFRNAAAVLEVTNANRFRIRAYQNAIATLEDLDEEISNLAQRMKLDNLPGIGKELSAKINEILTGGHSQELDELLSQVPQGMFPLLNIPGLGPKRAFQLSQEFNLTNPATSISQVSLLIKGDKLKSLPGWGEKRQALLKESISRVKPKSVRMRLDTADELAGKIINILQKAPSVSSVEVLGSLRRRQETIGDLDFAVATNNPAAVTAYLKNETPYIIEAAGANLIRLVLSSNKQVDVKYQQPTKFGATLQHFTGSKAHNIALREYALKKNLSLSEHGIKKNGKMLTFSDEHTFYHYLGLEYIPPELRQDTGEIDAALNGTLPKPVTVAQIKGDFHTHTNFNWNSSHDYGDSIDNLVGKAQERSYEWLAFGDHNPSVSQYTESDHIDVIRRRAVWLEREIQRCKKSENIRELNYFNTLEVDIKPSGELALSDKTLALLDFCIVSIHSAFTLNQQLQTKRILTALNHPKVKILGHPTGRLIPERPPINVDWDQIFSFCQEREIAVEINASPRRLDLPDSLVRNAASLGVMVALGTDSHQAGQMDLMPYAVDVAKRGWVRPNSILNTMNFDQLSQWLNHPSHPR